MLLTSNTRNARRCCAGATYKINTPFGMAYITINDLDGIPAEIFLNVGKAGSDVFAMAEALGRVCSLFLRYGDHGEKVELLIKHLKGIGGSGAIGFGANRVESIADAVAKALETHVLNNAHDDHVPAPIAATLELEDFNEALNAELKASVPSAAVADYGHGGHAAHSHGAASATSAHPAAAPRWLTSKAVRPAATADIAGVGKK